MPVLPPWGRRGECACKRFDLSHAAVRRSDGPWAFSGLGLGSLQAFWPVGWHAPPRRSLGLYRVAQPWAGAWRPLQGLGYLWLAIVRGAMGLWRLSPPQQRSAPTAYVRPSDRAYRPRTVRFEADFEDLAFRTLPSPLRRLALRACERGPPTGHRNDRRSWGQDGQQDERARGCSQGSLPHHS